MLHRPDLGHGLRTLHTMLELGVDDLALVVAGRMGIVGHAAFLVLAILQAFSILSPTLLRHRHLLRREGRKAEAHGEKDWNCQGARNRFTGLEVAWYCELAARARHPSL